MENPKHHLYHFLWLAIKQIKIENWEGLTDLGPKAENRKFFAQFSTPYLGMTALIDKIKSLTN